jgi:hypothetical protein
MEFSFGIPSQRGKSAAASSIELYSENAAITVLRNSGPRTSKTFVINSLAAQDLGLEEGSQIAFDLTKSTPIIVNATGMSLPKGMGYIVKAKKEYKGLTFKDSKLWAYFVKTYNLNETQDNGFELSNEPVTISPSSYSLTLMSKFLGEEVKLALEDQFSIEEQEINSIFN